MKRERIELNELSYQTLAQFGLSQAMIKDLPMHVLEDLSDGRHSPVLPTEVADESGERIKSCTRLAFIRKGGGYPALKNSSLERYDEAQQKLLLSGNAIIADARTSDGRSSKAFVQVDAGMNQVMSVLTSVIGRNLQVLVEQMRLGSAEVKGLQSGNPLTLIVENDLGTEGIDLNARTGRMCRGDKLKESPQFIKTTLLDVKKATAMITQRVDRIAHELDQQREEQNEEVGKKDDRTLQQEEQRVAQMERDDKNVPKEIVVIVDRRNFY